MSHLQRALSIIFPDACILCNARTDGSGGLCGACWRETQFQQGLLCEACGISLPGDGGENVLCDDCLATPRPWVLGRAVLSYSGAGRRIVLGLKHADRLDFLPALSQWMARAGASILANKPTLVPIPCHWSRRLKRRYNQAEELSRGISKCTQCNHLPDALLRPNRTPSQDGKTVQQRFANVAEAFTANPKRQLQIQGNTICLVDDVMTSGATLTAATETLYAAGASEVCVLVLARVEKAP